MELGLLVIGVAAGMLCPNSFVLLASGFVSLTHTRAFSDTYICFDLFFRFLNRYPPGSSDAERAGQHLAGGYYGALLQVCGDLDYLVKWLGLPHYSSSANLCVLCGTTQKGPTSWLDNRKLAEWTNTEKTPHTWKQTATTKSPLFALPGMSGLGVAYYYMH